MEHSRFVGARVRELRTQQGLRQAQLAEAAGISASYLNLLEHGRRRITPKVQMALAQALNVPAESLNADSMGDQITRLQVAAGEADIPVTHAEEFVLRHPDWGRVVLGQAAQLEAQERQIAALSDRVSYDPQLAASLHDVLSTVTSIRSTASILAQGDLDRDWQQRFHNNLFDDARRLAQSTSGMIGGLGQLHEGAALSATDEAEAYLQQNPDLMATGRRPQKGALAEPARQVLLVWLDQITRDEAVLPLAQLAGPARAADYDPFALTDESGGDLALVLRRLGALSMAGDHPPLGLAICDGAGAVLYRQQVDHIALPRGGQACPLWPVFTALARPGHPIATRVQIEGGPSLRIWAVSELRLQRDPAQPPVPRSVMLLRPDPEGVFGDAVRVGPGCRMCARTACAARREPSRLATPMGL